jgi:hypothetical protein
MVAERHRRARTKPRSSASKRREKRAKRRPLTSDENRRLRNKVDRVVCSPAWGDAAASEADAQGIDPSGARVREQLASYGIYPPPEDAGRDNLKRSHPVRMLQCDACDHLFPPQAIRSGGCYLICDECAIGGVCPGDIQKRLTEGIRQRAVYSELRQIGLVDREIVTLALKWQGASLRTVGEFCGLKKSQVHRLIKSALDKIHAKGFVLPEQPAQRPAKEIKTDPRWLDRTFAARPEN